MTELYRDQLVPIVSPAIGETFNGCELELLARRRLIHLDSGVETLADWFGQLGYQGLVSGMQVNKCSVARRAGGADQQTSVTGN